MSAIGKRKAHPVNPAARLSHDMADPSSSSLPSKRHRSGDVARDAASSGTLVHDTIEDDPELEEQDRKRNQQGRKGRLITSGYESESSDEDDGATHRRRAERKAKTADDNDDDGDDMFAANSDHEGGGGDESDKHKPRQRFLQLGEIEGQEFASRSRDKDQDSGREDNGDDEDDEQDPDLELEESEDEDDDAVGDGAMDLNARSEKTPPTSPGGTPLRAAEMSRKRKAEAGKSGKRGSAVRITGFNMKEEMQTGKFDEEGNYIENAKDPHADHDVWLAGNYSRSKIRAAREAQQKRERELQEKEAKADEEDNDEDDVKKRLVEHMRRAETVLGTLQRLGKEAKKDKGPKAQRRGIKQRRFNSSNSDRAAADDNDMDVDAAAAKAEAKPQAVLDLEVVTHLSSVLMSRFGQMDIYEQTYEGLLRDVRKSGLVRGTFDPASRFDEPSASAGACPGMSEAEAAEPSAQRWEYRWSPSYLAAAAQSSGGSVAPDIEIFGPFPKADIKGWAGAGYFGDNGERVLLRLAGSRDAWRTYAECMAS
ncbi:uncharacterized protein PFL1_01728 [Pseudozyma flocculosa PF-1]|uniref:GYF domain-containing protein n=1 Tax=Pseudozyma flocculosa TaxID=84751 RepID=A0A5C3EX52_9BASI|nr:uncharacterized protein PFL1_01728 [Pseudozyma flocculosa PF-1]EPQ30830.1 hypothetical protein PFL1_01728 [Pseudozyma flocculosa PF-1]SPO36798.1 uncharacterized protein PSFLO_02269 [Pseudozyma flocculosa]